MDKETKELRDMISDFILTIELILHGREWSENDKSKARCMVDYAQGLIGYPKDIGEVAKICKIDYPPTELEILRDEVKDLNKLVKELCSIPNQRIKSLGNNIHPSYKCACDEIQVFMDAEMSRWDNKEKGGTVVMENKK